MSSIEKAINKLQDKESKEVILEASNHRLKDTVPKEKEIHQDHVGKAGNNSENYCEKRTVTLAMEKLKAEGMLLPDSGVTQLSEEYRSIKRPLLKNAFGKGGQKVAHGNLIMVTSALPGEGKTFTSINLAMSIAMELDKTVLLVDADVSRAGVSTTLGFDPGKGLSDLLRDSSLSLSDVLIKTNISKLSVLSAGQQCSNINELMGSENMTQLIHDLASKYHDRVILFDSPPLIATTEARILAGYMGQILVVVEAEKTPQSVVKEAIEYLDSSKVIGLVLNKDRSSKSYGYGYGYAEREHVK